MLWNRRVETLLLMACGAALVFFSFVLGNNESRAINPAPGWALFGGLGVLAGAMMMCTGAVLDYLHQRNRPM